MGSRAPVPAAPGRSRQVRAAITCGARLGKGARTGTARAGPAFQFMLPTSSGRGRAADEAAVWGDRRRRHPRWPARPFTTMTGAEGRRPARWARWRWRLGDGKAATRGGVEGWAAPRGQIDCVWRRLQVRQSEQPSGLPTRLWPQTTRPNPRAARAGRSSPAIRRPGLGELPDVRRRTPRSQPPPVQFRFSAAGRVLRSHEYGRIRHLTGGH